MTSLQRFGTPHFLPIVLSAVSAAFGAPLGGKGTDYYTHHLARGKSFPACGSCPAACCAPSSIGHLTGDNRHIQCPRACCEQGAGMGALPRSRYDWGKGDACVRLAWSARGWDPSHSATFGLGPIDPCSREMRLGAVRLMGAKRTTRLGTEKENGTRWQSAHC